MAAMILRLLTLLALVAMPFGMGTAMAAPAHQNPTAAMAGSCAEHGGQPAQKSTRHSSDCAVTCSMLIAAETRLEDPAAAIRMPAARSLAQIGVGENPDTATPPPKLS